MNLLKIEYDLGTFEDATQATQGCQEAFPGTASDSTMDVSESFSGSQTPFEDGNNFTPIQSHNSESALVGKHLEGGTGLSDDRLTSAVEENVSYQEDWISGMCAKIFSGENFVNIHFDKKHIGETKRSTKIFACTRCTKSFAVLQNMQTHLRTHNTQ